MNLVIGALPYFGIAFILSLLMVPIAKKIGFALGIYAVENKRTVHHGKIVRFGALAIFLSFVITMSLLVKADKTINAIMIGGLIVFLGGVLDDMFDLRPIVKLVFIMVGALIPIIFGGIQLEVISLPFITIDIRAISFLVSFVWIIGVSNAINLIDGLDISWYQFYRLMCHRFNWLFYGQKRYLCNVTNIIGCDFRFLTI